MTEPREIAEEAEEVLDGLYHWHIHNSAIGGAGNVIAADSSRCSRII